MLTVKSGHNIKEACQAGAFVISLDFELYWGVRDRAVLDNRQKRRLMSARAIVPRLLDIFAKYSVHVTWATVGALFANSREQFLEYAPKQSPAYHDSTLRRGEDLGVSEHDDPYHFAPGLIAKINSYDGQEIGCHSFSHYSALECGQTTEHFRADLISSVRLAADLGVTLRSYVFPRNQINEEYLPAIEEQGFDCYRSNNIGSLWAAGSFQSQQRWYKRLGRLADNYLTLCGQQTREWPNRSGLAEVGSSRYLRPFSPILAPLDSLRQARIARAMHAAAIDKRIFHLWFHPEDFADYPEHNFVVLKQILEQFRQVQDSYDMRSLSMYETVAASRSCCAT